MRISLPVVAAVLAAALATPSAVRAQSLAEIAEKEKERRKAAKKPAKTFTEADLKRGGITTFNAQVGEVPAATASPAPEGAASPAPGAAASPAPAGAASPAPAGSPDQRAAREREWRERVKKAEESVAAITSQIQKLEAALNDQTTPQYGVGRANMTQQLAQAREQLGAARQTLENAQAEGRQNGYR
jgi:hypothetical protein